MWCGGRGRSPRVNCSIHPWRPGGGVSAAAPSAAADLGVLPLVAPDESPAVVVAVHV